MLKKMLLVITMFIGFSVHAADVHVFSGDFFDPGIDSNKVGNDVSKT